jgi:hypothetical protein
MEDFVMAGTDLGQGLRLSPWRFCPYFWHQMRIPRHMASAI